MPKHTKSRASREYPPGRKASRSLASKAAPAPRSPWVNLIYLAGILSSLIVGTYSTFLLAAPLLVDRDLIVLALSCAFPLALACLAYLIYTLRVLFSRTRRPRDTDRRNTMLASAAMCVLWFGGAIAFLLVRGT